MTTDVRRAIVAAGALLFLVANSPVAAHVTVNPPEAPKGGFAKLTFRVPNERDNAGTTKVEIAFPAEHPIEAVSVKPQPGWAYAVERSSAGAVTKVTWSGGPIKPGEFAEFDVSAGPLPEDADRLVFKALQTYENGEVVRWIEEEAPGGEEPEHPAPVLQLVAGGGEDGHSTPTTEAVADADGDGADDNGDDGDDGEALGRAAIVLGSAGLVLSLAALVLLLRRRP